MGKYVYKQGNNVVSREAFARFIAEECECDIDEICGFGVAYANYEIGEAVTKRMQRSAYNDWLRFKGRSLGQAITIYPVKGGTLEVIYYPIVKVQ